MPGERECGIHTEWSIIQLQKMKITSFSGKYMEPEVAVLSDISQTQKDKHSLFPLTCRL